MSYFAFEMLVFMYAVMKNLLSKILFASSASFKFGANNVIIFCFFLDCIVCKNTQIAHSCKPSTSILMLGELSVFSDITGL